MRVILARRQPGQRFAFDGKQAEKLPAAFFDGGCPLCAKEIAHYRRLDQGGAIGWTDLANDDVSSLERRGVTKATAMRRFHVLSSTGEMLIGAPAFVELWRHLPYWRAIVPLTRIPGVLPLADAAYEWFAARRLRITGRDGDCATGQCRRA